MVGKNEFEINNRCFRTIFAPEQPEMAPVTLRRNVLIRAVKMEALALVDLVSVVFVSHLSY